MERNAMLSADLLDGQVAWVTGSSRGLGRVMATELCRLGANVAVHGTRFDSPKSFGEGQTMEQVACDIERDAAHVAAEGPATEAEARGVTPTEPTLRHVSHGKTMAVWGDVTDEAEVKRMVSDIRRQFGKVDILVANAGGDIGAGG